ncbi:MAG: helix-turn-helix transcriptional regulator [Ruminococcaceae bacterium]|nr:helix-turn-helix transcriptional regulator [Oscillospiraceae bacterium]
MEKKTIGKFISALRKANGMTQREFGEKLFVSDKTVSRWECDECTPDLSLIPAIAEIFGITADELLRGERNNPERLERENGDQRQKEKSEKQFRFMLDRTRKKYQNFTMISVGITILGLIAAMIANLSFSKGLIAFCLALAFAATSEICQICFTVNARFSVDEEDDTRAQQLLLSNNDVVKTAIRISFFNLLSVSFCLPLVVLLDSPYYGLEFGSWLLWGGIFVLAIGVLAYIFYILKIRDCLCSRGLYSLTSSEKEAFGYNKKLLLKTIAVSLCIALVIGIGVFVLEVIGIRGLARKEVFYTCEDFKAFMENQYDTWYKEGYTYYDKEGDAVVVVPGEDYSDASFMKEQGKIVNSKGEVICEYYFHKSLNKSILFTESAEDKMPVTVITQRAYNIALNNYDYLHILLYGLMVLDVIACGISYLRKMKRA